MGSYCVSTRVLYIAGAGRSGSTLLELILGNIDGFCSVGEIRYLWEYWRETGRLCGCKEPLSRCSLWSDVRHSLEDRDVALLRASELAARHDRTRNLPRIACTPSRYFPHELVKATRHLYGAVDAVAKGSVIVDSSKVPSHLYLLAQTESLDLRILHLVRDNRAVAHSWSKRVKRESGKVDGVSKMPRRSLLTSTAVWVVENLATTTAARQLDLPYSLIRYEDFVSSPAATLQRSLGDLGLPVPELSHLSSGSFPVNPTHSVGGNPLRFHQDRIEIRADDRWRSRMPRWQRICLALMTYPMMRRFNYQI